MARYTAKSIKNVRSGQCVYRVHFWYSFEGGLEYMLTPTWFFGKRYLHIFSSKYKAIRIVPQDAFLSRERELARNVRRDFGDFLNDALGDAAFTSMRQAQRFCSEVMSGLHPELVQKKIQATEWKKRFSRIDMCIL